MYKAIGLIFLILVVAFLVRLFMFSVKSKDRAYWEKQLTGIQTVCGTKPNCVSSIQSPSDEKHFIEPIKSQLKISQAKQKLKEYFASDSKYVVAKELPNYLWVECKSSFFGFVDDLELFFNEGDPTLIHVKSSSRVGYSDMGVNRKRVDLLRDIIK